MCAVLDPRAPTKRDAIVETLRREILSGQRPRGSRLLQDRLADDFGASITPVREALRQLESEGLLVGEPKRGMRVASVSFDEVAATYIMRRLVESYAMRRAMFNLSRRDLSEAERLAEQAAAAADPQMARDLNRAFHFFFYERCGLPALTNRIDAMWRAFPWDLTLSTKDRAEASYLEHRELLQALRHGDEEAVAQATEEHIAHGFQSIAHRLDDPSKGDPFDFSLP